jgi:hypothetical protein
MDIPYKKELITLRDSLSIEEMFILYNSLNNFINSNMYYKEDIRPYTKLAKKIQGKLKTL